MKVIFNKTLRNMYKPVILGLYFGVIIFFTLIFVLTTRSNNALSILEQIETIKTTYTSFNFIYLSGIGLIFLMMVFGVDIFATEEYEGTMRILVAKPVSRRSIVIGKVLGLLIGTFIYYISSLIISITLYSLLLRLDKDVFIGVMSIIPSFIVFAIFMIFIFTSIASLLSSLFRKKTPAIVVFVVLVIIIYGLIPISRNILMERGRYQDLKLQYLDTNSHFGNIYMSLVEQGKEDNELYSQTIIMFTGRYRMDNRDPDIEEQGNFIKMQKSNLVNVPLVTIIYTSISLVLFYISYNIMTKKDIT